MSDPASVQLRPEDLAQDMVGRDLLVQLHSGPWLLIHGASRDPLAFGPSLGHGFGEVAARVHHLQASLSLAGAFLAVYGERRRYGALAMAEVQDVRVSELRSRRPARFVDLRGLGSAEPASAGAWARAADGHPARPDGVICRTRRDLDEASVVIFDRLRVDLAVVTTGPLLQHPDFDAVLERHGIGLLGMPRALAPSPSKFIPSKARSKAGSKARSKAT